MEDVGRALGVAPAVGETSQDEYIFISESGMIELWTIGYSFVMTLNDTNILGGLWTMWMNETYLYVSVARKIGSWSFSFMHLRD